MWLSIGFAAVLCFAGLAPASAEDNGPPPDTLPPASPSINHIDPLTMPPELPSTAAAISEPQPEFPWEGHQADWEDVPATTQKQQQPR
jgi:hypothetical protein